MVEHYDAVIIGAGVGGLYALHHLRAMGLSVRVYDAAAGVGGTWWWNCYPGARVDGPGSPFYCYTFSEELVREWDWAETQPSQAQVLTYLEHVADRFDLRRDIQLETWVSNPRYDEAAQRWTVETSAGQRVSAQFLICAAGTPLGAAQARLRRVRRFHWRVLPHRPLAAGARFLCRQARRRDRDWLFRGAVDSRDRSRGGASDRVSAYAAVQHPGSQPSPRA